MYKGCVERFFVRTERFVHTYICENLSVRAERFLFAYIYMSDIYIWRSVFIHIYARITRMHMYVIEKFLHIYTCIYTYQHGVPNWSHIQESCHSFTTHLQPGQVECVQRLFICHIVEDVEKVPPVCVCVCACVRERVSI